MLLRRSWATRAVKLKSERRRAKRSPSFVLGHVIGRGNILPRCVPGRLAMARLRPDAFPDGNPWQVFRFMHPKSGLGQEKAPLPGNISPPCIQNELVLARYARHVSEKPRKSPFGNAPREDLAREGPFSPHWPLESCTARESCHPAAVPNRSSVPQRRSSVQEVAPHRLLGGRHR